MNIGIQSEKLARVIARAIMDDGFRENLLMCPRQILQDNEVVIPEDIAIRIEHGHATGTIETPTEYVIHLPESVEPIAVEEVEHQSGTFDYVSTAALPFCAVYLED